MMFDQLDRSLPFVMTSAEMVPVMRTPTRDPQTLPTPPVSSVPPMTADAIAVISRPFAWVTAPVMEFRQNRMPPMEHRKDDST